eukprot:CAMPEP_0183715402 /NCGR_PEP_ID=MMETSP0737-20130205/9635_1 /TAXON_ID=385413 /ORGANISM="Thalassiosira miniscula, Strain CCMP1093" /LENGTH=472 /DNA_ID=CAMNT_0025944493 /DNA_START=93 /DNA_END=1511 /DNA_ORIENTATION=+
MIITPLLHLLLGARAAQSFLAPSPCTFPASLSPSSLSRRDGTSTTQLFMAKTKNKKKKKSSGSSSGGAGGLKGFGGGSSSGTAKKSATKGEGGTIDRSPSALRFYDYLQRAGGGSNLKRVGLGYFPLQIGPTPDDILQLRGVIALRDIPKGDPIIEIPYEMALDLGRESSDPTLPATTLLQKYCAWRSDSDGPPGDKERGDYFAMLPPYLSADCLGSTDFFSEEALAMLQSPMVVEETKLRRELVEARYERDVQPMAQMSSNLYRWEKAGDNDVDDDESNIATLSHLQWASWIITSRVLTVQGPPESSIANRVLIPLIDMCNHDRDSPHILTGRAMPGGMLKVVAGADVKTGDAINIGYGGSVEGNDRFVQDYGFLDGGGSKERGKKTKDGEEFVAEAYKIVAKKLLGKGAGRSAAGKRMSVAEQEAEMEALQTTSLEEDEALLGSGKVVKDDERMALEYRIGMKKALKQLM